MTVEDMFRSLQAGQTQILGKLEDMERRQEKLEGEVALLNRRMTDVEGKIGDLETAASNIGTWKSQCDRLYHANRKLLHAVDDLENRSRRNNLIFFGFEDRATETWAESEKLVTDLCGERLGIEMGKVERAHRLGKYQAGKKRPVIVCFSFFKDREEVLTNASKLKGTPFSVSKDYSAIVREKRKHLWAYAKPKMEDRNNKVKLSHDKLIINGKSFTWDLELNEVVPVRAP